jgi:hypothetical protein
MSSATWLLTRLGRRPPRGRLGAHVGHLQRSPRRSPRRIRGPRPEAVYFVSHGGLGEPWDWNSWGVRRIGDGDSCDESTPIRTPARSALWVCAYAARASHATYSRSGKHARDGAPNDHVTTDFDDRWHLRRVARLDGLRSHGWACWAGRAGQRVPAAGRAIHSDAPLMPLRQQRAYRRENCELSESATKSSARASASAARGGDPESEIDKMNECREWAPPIYRPGETRIVACDQHQLDAWLRSDDGGDEQRAR